MDEQSEEKLQGLDPLFADKIRAAADELAASGTHIFVVSGFRSAEEQNKLYAQGRSTPGLIVTHARAGYSMHNFGLAADIVPRLSGDSGALNWKADTPQFRAMVAALEKQGLVWGGVWKSFPDYDHFQMPGLPATPTSAMRADYGEGTLVAIKEVWKRAAGGDYYA